MPCNLDNQWPRQYVDLGQIPDVTNAAHGTCIALQNTAFFYSNYPEKLLRQNVGNGVLWSHARALSPGEMLVNYRCFL